MNTMLRRAPRQLAVAESLEWCPDGGQRWQLFDGEPRAAAPSKSRHRLIQAELARLILSLATPYRTTRLR